MHALDCDGVSMGLFHHLARETRKMESARIFIPQTVVFDQGFAAAWYFSTPLMAVKRHTDKDINLNDIFKAMSSGVPPTCADVDICAVFYSTEHQQAHFFLLDENVPTSTDTTYMDKNTLKQFLFAPGEKPRGILQQFVYPKGLCVTSISAIWSRNVTMIEGIRNPYSMRDKTKTIGERGGTFELPNAQQISTTNSVTAAVRQLSTLIVQHLQQVEHVQVKGMILQFRVSENNRVVLLNCTSLRVQKTDSIEKDDCLPLNMMHSFVGEKERKDIQDQKEAKEAKEMRRKMLAPRDKGGKGAQPAVSLNNSSSVLSNRQTSMADSSVYKQAALKLLHHGNKKVRSKLVLPALLGAVKHNGQRWVPVQGSPIPIAALLADPTYANAMPNRRAQSEPLRNTCEVDLGDPLGQTSGDERHGTLSPQGSEQGKALVCVVTPEQEAMSGSQRGLRQDASASSTPNHYAIGEDGGLPPLERRSTLENAYMDQGSRLEAKRCFADMIYRLESSHLAGSKATTTYKCIFEFDFLEHVVTQRGLRHVMSPFDIHCGVAQEHMTQLDTQNLAGGQLDMWPAGYDKPDLSTDQLCVFECPTPEFNKNLSAARWNLLKYIKRFGDTGDAMSNRRFASIESEKSEEAPETSVTSSRQVNHHGDSVPQEPSEFR